MRIAIVTSCIALAIGCAADAGPSEADRTALMEADRAFAERVRTGDLDAWVESFADSGFMLVPDVAVEKGHDAVRRAMVPAFADDWFILHWEPSFAEVSASGDIGFTVGTFTGQRTARDGDPVPTSGKYVTLWQKNVDGEWKVLLDAGVPDTRPRTP